MQITTKDIFRHLQKVIHPELKKDIVTLGIVQDVRITDNHLTFTLSFNKASDLSEQIKQECLNILKQSFPGIDIQINVKSLTPNKNTNV